MTDSATGRVLSLIRPSHVPVWRSWLRGDPFPIALPERMPGTSGGRALASQPVTWWAEFLIPNS